MVMPVMSEDRGSQWTSGIQWTTGIGTPMETDPDVRWWLSFDGSYTARMPTANVKPIRRGAKPVLPLVSKATIRMTVTRTNVAINSMKMPWRERRSRSNEFSHLESNSFSPELDELHRSTLRHKFHLKPCNQSRMSLLQCIYHRRG